MYAPIFAPVFGSEEEFTQALRARALATFDTSSPRRDLIPLILSGADDDELRAIFAAGETARNYKLYFHPFAQAIAESDIGAQRLVNITRRFQTGENGASLAAWGALIAGGADAFPDDLDDYLDFAPCDVRTLDEAGRPLGDLPAMQTALAGVPLDRLRRIVDVSMTARPNWPKGWRSSRYITSFGFIGALEDETLLDRLIAERQEALDAVAARPIAERQAVSNAWEAASFEGQDISVPLLVRGQASDDFTAMELDFAVLQVSAGIDGHVIADVDEILDYAVEFELPRLATILPLLDEERRDAVLDRALDQGAYFYGSLLAEVFEPDRLYRLAKRKKRVAKEAALAVLDQLQGREELALALDASFPEVVAQLGLKLSSDERELYAGILGAPRFQRWWS